MKKYILYILAVIFVLGVTSCRNDDLDDKSIFEDITEDDMNKFDEWLMTNFIYPYNIEVLYKWKDVEASHTYEIVPADYDKAVTLARLVKHVWLEAYDEAANVTFTREMAPKILLLIGSGAWNTNGSVVLGTAEGGLKVTLYRVNDLTLTIGNLNERYFKTMHHEFGHILNQTIPYSEEFQQITEDLYVGSEWTNSTFSAESLSLGFVTPYSRFSDSEDFVEIASVYVTNTEEYWDNLLNSAGEDGKAIILKKFEYVYNYYLEKWEIDLDELRDIVARRTNEAITELDLSALN